ncbi:hypothetical protein J6590_072772 [Homalodisca vitripennis]|nr:hypothetical protein J6590_072772 [Homalodisca vitripennis]
MSTWSFKTKVREHPLRRLYHYQELLSRETSKRGVAIWVKDEIKTYAVGLCGNRLSQELICEVSTAKLTIGKQAIYIRSAQPFLPKGHIVKPLWPGGPTSQGIWNPKQNVLPGGHTNYVASVDLELGRGYVAAPRALFASRQPPP